MNHKEYFHSGKVAIKANNELEHTVLNTMFAVDGVKPRELYNESYPYVMVEDPNNEGLKIVSYGAVSPRAKASFDSVLHFLAATVPTFTLNLIGGIKASCSKDGVVLEFGEYKLDSVFLSNQELERVVSLKKEFDNFHEGE
jgi:hypothetical protein